MSKVKVKLNSEGIQELLKSSMVMDLLEKEAEARAVQAGPGYSVNTYVGKKRCNAEIRTETEEAERDNLEKDTLVRLIS